MKYMINVEISNGVNKFFNGFVTRSNIFTTDCSYLHFIVCYTELYFHHIDCLYLNVGQFLIRQFCSVFLNFV